MNQRRYQPLNNVEACSSPALNCFASQTIDRRERRHGTHIQLDQ